MKPSIIIIGGAKIFRGSSPHVGSLKCPILPFWHVIRPTDTPKAEFS